MVNADGTKSDLFLRAVHRSCTTHITPLI